MPAGRPTIYTEDIAERIADRLAGGESLAVICRDDDMPGLRTVVRWTKDNADFGLVYACAREAQAEEMDHQILTEAQGATAETAQAVRVRIDAYKWRAARLNPLRYGERLDLTSGGEKLPPPSTLHIDAKVQAIMLAGARRRDLELPDSGAADEGEQTGSETNQPPRDG